MNCNWKSSTIADVCKVVTDGAHNSPPSVDDGEYMVSVKDFSEYGFDFTSCRKISRGDYDKLMNAGCVPEVDDVLIGKDGARYFEDVIIYRQKEKPALLSSIAILRADKEKILPGFLYYTMKIPSFKKNVRDNFGSGSAIPRIVLKDFKRMEICYPSVVEQEKIVQFLEVLDGKIRTNRRINSNLEQQAMLLVANSISDLQETIELGKIMSFENGYAFQSKTYLSEGKYRIITIKNVQDGMIDSQGAAFINEIPSRMKAGCFLQEGDVLLSLTGYVGRVGIVYEKNLLLNQRVAKFVPVDSLILPWLYYYFRLPSIKLALETIAKGTAQLNLSPVETLNLQVPFEMSSAKKLSNILWPIFNQEIANNIETLRLSELRNTLLPRLMSGEIDVSKVAI